MYLSQLLVNPRSRDARIDLGDRHELHRTLLSAFPEDLPADERILFRVEDNRNLPVISVLVQSRYLPDWDAVERMQRSDYLMDVPQVRRIVPNVNQGQRLPFRLQANPTVKRSGKRHARYDDAELMEWLQLKGNQHGFTCDPLDVQIAKLGKKYGKRRQATWHAVQFDGALTITNDELFSATLVTGIGSAKAFGFGLLSIPYRSA
jgi:CRISPR system Cascade subunit CasE